MMKNLLSFSSFILAALSVSVSAAVTHETAPTQYADVSGVRYAYRLFGPAGGIPLVFLNHSRGTLDSWDPTLVNALAETRTVLLFDNAGVGGSGGTTPDNFSAMARDAVSLFHALHFNQVDLLGFSIGGCVAQEIALQEPALVHRMILAGTSPEGGEDIILTGKAREVFMKPSPGGESTLYLFFAPSETSQAAGKMFLERRQARKDRVPAVTPATAKAQAFARDAWGAPQPELYARLSAIKIPVLVANGNQDVMMQTKNSFILSQHLPDATLLIYPDSGHGFLFQYATRFAGDVTRFLDQ